jgi:P4 family phage/plasmid primase-like protien
MNYAGELYAAGFTDLVRVAEGQKVPVDQGWQEKIVSATEAAGWAGFNVGLRAANYPAIDIDFADDKAGAEEIAAMVTAQLGPAPRRYSPKPGSILLIYQTEEPFRKMKVSFPGGKAVEVLGDGQQYLVAGRHPLGADYRWQGGKLADVKPAKLVRIERDEVVTAMGLVAERFKGVFSGGSSVVGEGKTPEELAAPDPSMVVDLLEVIPNTDEFLADLFPDKGAGRDSWLSMCMAVKGAGGAEVMPAFIEWTARYEDGPVDLARAEHTFRTCDPKLLGWPKLRRLHLQMCVSADDVFEVERLNREQAGVGRWLEPFATTDDMIAREISVRLGGKAVPTGRSAWYIWRGNIWEYTDAPGMMVRDELYKVAEELTQVATVLETQDKDKEAKKYHGRASQLLSRASIDNLTALVRGELAVSTEEFVEHKFRLNTPGGLVNLEDGTTRPVRPSDSVTCVTAFTPADTYDPAKAPAWESFLDHATNGDRELRRFLQRWYGYTLTGDMGEKKFMFVYGHKSNTGKSTLVNAIADTLGSYARSTDVDTFMGRKTNTDALAQLEGKRMVVATEPSAGQMWDDKIIKAITGGDPIEARRLYQSERIFYPVFKLTFAGNHEPELKTVDAPLLKRLTIIPMNNQIQNPDSTMGARLKAEGPQILRWCIDGCLEWQEFGGLRPPESVQVATDSYQSTVNSIDLWIESECSTSDASARTSTDDLLIAYKEYAKQTGAPQMRRNQFRAEMLSRFSEGRTGPDAKGPRGFVGIRLGTGVFI